MDNKFIQQAENRMNKVLMEMEKLENMALHRLDISNDSISKMIDAIQIKINEAKKAYEDNQNKCVSASDKINRVYISKSTIGKINGEYDIKFVSNCEHLDNIKLKAKLIGNTIIELKRNLVAIITSTAVTVYSNKAICLSKSAKGLFSHTLFKTIDLSGVDTTGTINMSEMFYYSEATEIILNGIDTSKVEDMCFMLSCSNVQKIDLSSFNTSNVKNMDRMFAHSKLVELNINSFNTTNVSRMWAMFENTVIQELDLSNFYFDEGTYVLHMFSNCAAASNGKLIINNDFFKALASC